MRMGRRSLLIGSHQFILHPLFLARAWWKLHSFPWDPRLWFVFIVHDWGYWWCETMDGEDGVEHPRTGAALVYRVLGVQWAHLAAGHSRTYAKRHGLSVSDLMAPDKLATALYPPWLYVLLCSASGEWVEYRDRWVASVNKETGKSSYPGKPTDTCKQWAGHLQDNWRRFAHTGAVVGEAYGGE